MNVTKVALAIIGLQAFQWLLDEMSYETAATTMAIAAIVMVIWDVRSKRLAVAHAR